MIELYCQHCGHHLKIPDQYAGQTGTCNNCRKNIVVPGVGFESDRPIVPARMTKNIPYKWIGATAAVMTTLAIGVYLIGDYLKEDGGVSMPPQTVAAESIPAVAVARVTETAQIASQEEGSSLTPSFETKSSLISKALRERVAPLLPTEEENRFRRIPWRTDLLKARREANEKRKPIFMWLMAGNPLGCV